MKQTELDQISLHFGIIRGYLFSVSCPIEVVRSLEFFAEQFEISSPIIDDVFKEDEKSRSNLSVKERQKIWHMRMNENKKPEEIANSFPGITPQQISSALAYMKKKKKRA